MSDRSDSQTAAPGTTSADAGDTKAVSKPLPPERSLNLQTRYAAASNEINTRVNARQVSYLGHVVAAATILKLIFDSFGQTSVASNAANVLNTAKNRAEPLSPGATLLILSPAIVGIAFGCWIRSHDLIIGMLSTFCRFCEQESNEKDALPRWHTGWWQRNSMRHREWIEIAYILINVLVVVMTTSYADVRLNDRSWQATVIQFINFLALGQSSWLVLSIAKHRKWLSSLNYKEGKVYHEQVHLPDTIALQPNALLLFVAVAGIVVTTILGSLCRQFEKNIPQVWLYSGIVIWGLAVACRVVAEFWDWETRESVGKSPTLSAYFYLTKPYWLVPILVGGSAVLLFAAASFQFTNWISVILIGHSLSRDAQEKLGEVGLWISGTLLGYGFPELFQTWRYKVKIKKEKLISGKMSPREARLAAAQAAS